jgi:hypothetical protein
MYFGLGLGIVGVDGRVMDRQIKYRWSEFGDN